MLPVPQLDDKAFLQFVQDTGRLLRNHAPEWTDENLHDPGITFIELFAWLAEMQQFYLDQIGDKNYKKFLKLLGIKLRKAVSATVDVSFDGIVKPLTVPQGSKLFAGEIPFEIDETVYLTPATIDKVLVSTATNAYDYTSSNTYKGIGYYAFGEDAQKGSRLFIGFDKKLPFNQKIDITFDLAEEKKEAEGYFENEAIDLIPSTKVRYQYFGNDDGNRSRKADWQPLVIIKDNTVNLLKSGRLSFKILGEMKEATIYPANDRERFWISLTLDEAGYEFPPKIEKVKLNAVGATQKESFCELLSFSGTGKPHQKVIASTLLTFCGNVDVQLKGDDKEFIYWKKVNSLKGCNPKDRVYTASMDGQQKRLSITFGNGQNGMIPPIGEGNIRLVSYLPSFGTGIYMGRSNGLCYQKFKVPFTPVISKSFKLQTGNMREDSWDYLWSDWELVEDFDASGSESRHFLLDEITGEISFGDNLRGMVPEIGQENNIRIISYQAGGGTIGNIRQHQINKLAYLFEDSTAISVTNEKDAAFGQEKESLEKAIVRARKELKKPFCAVTAEDYEEIAINTPDVNVARVKALPLFAPGLKKYPEETVPAQVTLVVVPESFVNTPVPSKGLLMTVRSHLEQHRLITTELHVIGPTYVKVSIHAVIAGVAGNKVSPRKVEDALKLLLRPLDGVNGSKGWAFGRTVYKGDIYGFIKGIEGIEFIKDLWIDAEGVGIEQKPNGDIAIPPYALVYSGQHEIEVIGNQ